MKRMIPEIAENIYNQSLALKSTNEYNLLFGFKRRKLLKELRSIQSLTNQLIICLDKDEPFSKEYHELAEFMNASISKCILLLTTKKSHNTKTALKYARGFHNLPRAFFALSNSLRISTTDARNFYNSYTNPN